MNLIATIALVTTNLTTITAVLIKLYKFVRKWDMWSVQKDKYDRENYLTTLRLTIMSHEMPLSERIAAGDKYIKLGGNGAVRHKYEELLTQLPKEK